MSDTPDPLETLEEALAQIQRLLVTDAALAAEQAAQILATVPDHPVAMLYLGIAKRFTGDAAGALAALEPLARSQPDWANVARAILTSSPAWSPANSARSASATWLRPESIARPVVRCSSTRCRTTSRTWGSYT